MENEWGGAAELAQGQTRNWCQGWGLACSPGVAGQLFGSESCITNMDELWALHPKQIYEKCRQWSWMLSSNQTHPSSLSRLGITLSMTVLWFFTFEVLLHQWCNSSTQTGGMWHNGHGADPACATLQAKVGRKSLHWVPSVAACSSFCEKVFSLFLICQHGLGPSLATLLCFGEETPSKQRLHQ